MKNVREVNLFSLVRLAMLVVVILLLAFSFPAADHYYNAVHPASDWPALDALATHNLAELRRVTAGPRIEALDNNTDTPLILAIRVEDSDAIQDLLSRGADVNHCSDCCGSPLMTALSSSNAPVARMLIDRHADVNYQTHDGDTALLAAVRGGNRACIDLILASGAERYAVGARRNALSEATASDDTLVTLRYLISKKFDPNWTARDGIPPIVSAAAYGSSECVKALIDAGADVTLPDRSHRTAWSVSEGFPEVRKVLAKHS